MCISCPSSAKSWTNLKKRVLFLGCLIQLNIFSYSIIVVIFIDTWSNHIHDPYLGCLIRLKTSSALPLMLPFFEWPEWYKETHAISCRICQKNYILFFKLDKNFFTHCWTMFPPWRCKKNSVFESPKKYFRRLLLNNIVNFVLFIQLCRLSNQLQTCWTYSDPKSNPPHSCIPPLLWLCHQNFHVLWLGAGGEILWDLWMGDQRCWPIETDSRYIRRNWQQCEWAGQ